MRVLLLFNLLCEKIKVWQTFRNCSGQPGIVYNNFNIQNLVTYKDNIKYKSDISLLAYIDFGTTAPTGSCLNSEDKKMSAVPYVIILAFHPELKLGRVIIEGSFGHSPDKLLNIDYLTQGKWNL